MVQHLCHMQTAMYTISVFAYPDNLNNTNITCYGDIAEIAIYKSALSDSDISSLKTELERKSGLT